MSGLTGRRAIVTGAASGIGRAIAEDLASQGVHVLVTDINADGGARVASSIKGVFERADMSSARECDAVVARALREWQGVDILVNNAGLQHVAPVEEFPVDRWEHIVKTMLFGAFYLTRAAPLSLRRKQASSLPEMPTPAASRRWQRKHPLLSG